MVTAELALAIPAIAFVAAMLAWLISVGVGQGMVVQAAREGARLAARGEGTGAVQEAARAVVEDASVSVQGTSERVVVRVSVRREPPLRLLRPLAIDQSATATGWRER